MMKPLLGVIFAIIGITLVVINSSWLVALGVYLMIAANNIDRILIKEQKDASRM